MGNVFLSASVPVRGRGHYYESADPFLIQVAVREFMIAAIARHKIVWGGHPAITPMIWAICADLDVSYRNSVTLYQSRFFQDRFPEENQEFQNVILVDAVPGSQNESLARMRARMFGDTQFDAAVFIGGMEGVEHEHAMFTEAHPNARVLFVPGPGGAARDMASRLWVDGTSTRRLNDVNFARLFRHAFGEPTTDSHRESE